MKCGLHVVNTSLLPSAGQTFSLKTCRFRANGNERSWVSSLCIITFLHLERSRFTKTRVSVSLPAPHPKAQTQSASNDCFIDEARVRSLEQACDISGPNQLQSGGGEPERQRWGGWGGSRIRGQTFTTNHQRSSSGKGATATSHPVHFPFTGSTRRHWSDGSNRGGGGGASPPFHYSRPRCFVFLLHPPTLSLMSLRHGRPLITAHFLTATPFS